MDVKEWKTICRAAESPGDAQKSVDPLPPPPSPHRRTMKRQIVILLWVEPASPATSFWKKMRAQTDQRNNLMYIYKNSLT